MLLDLLLDKLGRRIEKTFDIFRRIIRHQYADVLYLSGKFQFSLSHYCYYRSNPSISQLISVLCKYKVAQSESLSVAFGLRVDYPIEIVPNSLWELLITLLLHLWFTFMK